MRHSPCFLFLICVFSLYGEEAKIEVLFSPKGGCTEAIISQIGKAEQSIYVQAYSFTSKPIAEALIAAHKKGIRIQIQVDKGQKTATSTAAYDTLKAGIPTSLDSAHAIAHNKIIIIDEKIVITGSFNFTKSAEESNAENLLIIQSQELARRYLDNWRKHAEHCRPLEQ
jgi:phosphatidylserine/phosphatidylglycerophosphate/cardiolipin synthase-like enzyme